MASAGNVGIAGRRVLLWLVLEVGELAAVCTGCGDDEVDDADDGPPAHLGQSELLGGMISGLAAMPRGATVTDPEPDEPKADAAVDAAEAGDEKVNEVDSPSEYDGECTTVDAHDEADDCDRCGGGDGVNANALLKP